MIKKLCSYPGCHKVVEAGVKYCDKHRETDRKKYREYKQRRMRDEQEARRQQFYNSKAWEQFRAAQAAAQLGIDIYEYYTTGRIIDAENYHHIQEITEAWARRLDAANVIGLSEANHRRIGLLIQLVVYGVSIGAIYGTIKTRLNYIEAKLDKHNNVVERVYKLEKDQAVLDEKQEVANHRIKDLEGLSAQ